MSFSTSQIIVSFNVLFSCQRRRGRRTEISALQRLYDSERIHRPQQLVAITISNIIHSSTCHRLLNYYVSNRVPFPLEPLKLGRVVHLPNSKDMVQMRYLRACSPFMGSWDPGLVFRLSPLRKNTQRGQRYSKLDISSLPLYRIRGDLIVFASRAQVLSRRLHQTKGM